MSPSDLTLRVLFPLPYKDLGISHICGSLCRHIGDKSVSLRLFTTRVSIGAKKESYISATLPRIGSFIPYSMVKNGLMAATERRFLRSVKPGHVAYLWSDCTVDLFHRLKKAGTTVIREKYNCHLAKAKVILDTEYERLGLAPGHSITEQSIALEREQLELADFICCPSPMVAQSMLQQGINPEKVIDSSYGWSPQRFLAGANGSRIDREFTVLFVGSIGVRKGAHLLLEAWAKSGIKGRLLLVGPVERNFGNRFAELLSRKDVTVTGFVSDPAPYFREASVFAFPSLEEGDPLVSYEAAANGLPLLVSPMGAGRGVRNDHEGIVLDPHDQESWVESLRKFASNPDLRRHYGIAAKQRSEHFTWQMVGNRLAEILLSRISGTVTLHP